jgi:branched-chain amino acid transport system substrate-binding protein
MSDRELTAGLSISLSGRFQMQGQQALNGFLLWQSLVNTQGGIPIGAADKRHVRLIWYDDCGQVHRARDNVSRLLRDDKVDILFGPYSSGLTLAAAEIAEEFRKVLWNYGGSSDEIYRHGWRYVVGIASPASDYLRALPSWLAKNSPRARPICVFYAQKGSFGWQVARGVLESARSAGQIVELLPIASSVKDHNSMLFFLNDVGPEVVVLAASFQDELTLIRTRQNWPASVRTVAAVAAGISAFLQELGALAEEVMGPSQWEPNVSWPDIVGPSSGWFAEKFQNRFGYMPDYIAAASFSSGTLLEECMRRARCLDSDALRHAASELDFFTFYGRFRIDPDSGKQLAHRILLVQWQRGQKVVLRD